MQQSRFKSYLIAQEKLVSEAKEIRGKIEELISLYEAQQLHASEFALLILIVYLQERAPEKWWMKKSHREVADERLSLKTQILSAQFSFLSQRVDRLWDIGFYFQLKKLPEGIFKTLYAWRRGEYQLHLWREVITPLQMLEFQANGERGVAFCQNSCLRGQLVDGKRDALEFMLHDLTHAHHFFNNKESHLMQTDFFKKLRETLLAEGLLQSKEREFRYDLDYLMSDMNSNIFHLQSQWRAILVKYFLSQEGRGLGDVLSSAGKSKVDNLCARLELGDKIELQNSI